MSQPLPVTPPITEVFMTCKCGAYNEHGDSSCWKCGGSLPSENPPWRWLCACGYKPPTSHYQCPRCGAPRNNATIGFPCSICGGWIPRGYHHSCPSAFRKDDPVIQADSTLPVHLL